MELDLIVTRHPGLVAYLQEIGLVAPFCPICGGNGGRREDHEGMGCHYPGTLVVAHATPDNVRGKNVCGVLPHSLSCLTASFTEVPLALPAELRGIELSLNQIRQFAGSPITYKVGVVS